MRLANKILNTLKKTAGFKSAPLAISIFWGVAVLMFAFTLSSYAVWNSPTDNPPNDNTDTPLNVSVTPQSKVGGLILNTGGADTGLFVGGAITGIDVISGNVVIADLVSCATIETDASGNLSCGSGGGGLWTKSGSNLYPTTISDNVGIGTTSPGYKLDVLGSARVGGNLRVANLRIEATDTTGAPATAASLQIHGYEGRGKGIFITDVNNTDEWFIGEGYNYAGIGIGYDTTAGGLSEYAVNAKLFVNSSGNVGIGTTSPGAKLDIDSGSGVQNIMLAGSEIGDFYDGILHIRSGGSVVAFDGSDNVGIGTTTPAGKLEVSYLAGQAGINSTGPTGNTHLPWTNGWNYISGNGIIFRDTGNVERMRYVASTGRLGIGTTGPTERLHVIGNVRANRYYDDNTAYYIDSNITSQMNSIRLDGSLQINNTSPTVYFQDVDHRSAMIHVNSNIWYVLRGCGNNSLSWCSTGGRWPLAINLNNNYATFGGGMSVPGSLQVGGGGGRIDIGDDTYLTDINVANALRLCGEQSGCGSAVFFLGTNAALSGYAPWTLEVGGGGSGRIVAGAFFYISDRSLKTNIEPLPIGSLDKVMQLQGVSFDWTEDEGGASSIGFIAQDVEPIFPDIITSRQDGKKTLDYAKLTVPLVEAIKEQQAQIDLLRVEIEGLKLEINKLK